MATKTPLPARLAALALIRTQIGVHETTPNWGPQIKRYLASTGISYPAAWCMATVHWCFQQVGVKIGGGASVGNFNEWARQNGKLVARPFRGDVVCYDWNGDGWPDHAGLVERVLALRWKGKAFAGWVQTIEGNSHSGLSGSTIDSVDRHRRWVKKCTFVRVKT